MGAAQRSSWLWLDPETPPDVAAIAAFLARERARDVFVSVPLGGPSELTRHAVAALRRHGIRVAALGGDPAWVEPADALAWAARASGSGLFAGLHLDIEPWCRKDWAGNERRLLAGLVRTAREVAASTPLPVEVDLAPWLADDHPEAFAELADAAGSVTLMAYRDRPSEILAFSAAARRQLGRARTPYRIGVETRSGPPPHVTFADDGRAVLERELAAVAAALASDEWFAGFAVHDAAGWARLAP